MVMIGTERARLIFAVFVFSEADFLAKEF